MSKYKLNTSFDNYILRLIDSVMNLDSKEHTHKTEKKKKKKQSKDQVFWARLDSFGHVGLTSDPGITKTRLFK